MADYPAKYERRHDMANMRKKGKKRVAFWLTEAERSLIKELADAYGVNQTDAFRTILIKTAKQEGIIKNEKKANKGK